MSASKRESNGKWKLPNKELAILSNTIKASSTYLRNKQAHIDSIKVQLSHAGNGIQRWQSTYRLAEVFRQFNTDSALLYADRCMKLAVTLGEAEQQKSKIVLINALSTAGIFTHALDYFSGMKTAEMSNDIKCMYWQAGRMLYSYMCTYVEGQKFFYNDYKQRYKQFDDSLLRHLPAKNKFREFISCERMVSQGQYKVARQKLENFIETLSPLDNLYAMATYQLAQVYYNQGDETMYATYLARSAVSDVKGCVREAIALPTLAKWLYEQGDLGDAFEYVTFALEDAMSGNVRMRTVYIAKMVSLIDAAYQKKMNSSRDELMIYFILVTFLLIGSAILLFILFKQTRRSRINARRLVETSRRQEAYIGSFITLYSAYVERLERLKQLVSLKVSSGKIEELQKVIESGRFDDENTNDIFKRFDNAFLDIFPEFVDDINKLLREEERIQLKEENTLTPELRIYAFMRLGVEESSKLAQVLHYSTNTVYAYRNRIRNKAINRDTFDEDVMKIGRYS